MDARLHVSRLSGQATVPPSKSAAHRAVLCAALADGVSHITNIEYSQDRHWVWAQGGGGGRPP